MPEGCHCNFSFFVSHAHFFQWYLLAASVRKATPLFCVCSMPHGILFYKAPNLYEATSTFTSHVPMPAVHSMILPIWVKSGTYLDCYPGQWVIQVSSYDPVSMLTWKTFKVSATVQRWNRVTTADPDRGIWKQWKWKTEMENWNGNLKWSIYFLMHTSLKRPPVKQDH